MEGTADDGSLDCVGTPDSFPAKSTTDDLVHANRIGEPRYSRDLHQPTKIHSSLPLHTVEKSGMVLTRPQHNLGWLGWLGWLGGAGLAGLARVKYRT